MSPNKTSSTRTSIRLLYAIPALITLALLLIASPSQAARPQPSHTNDSPRAVCPPDGQCFADVLPDNPFYTFTNRIYQQDLVTGYRCGSPEEPCDPESRPYFRPVNNVTRQQMAKFIDNGRHQPGIDISVSSGDPPIKSNNDTGTAIEVYSFSGLGITALTGGSGSYYALGGYNGADGTGLYGYTASGTGVRGFTGNAAGNWAGTFGGNVDVTGTCCNAGAGTYRIDDPLDPQNKYLYHSAVESPDMKNIYDGIAVLDDKGEAWVQLPDWFEALNMDYRYQLTPIGAPGRDLYISHEIENNRFSIAGGQPSLKVSWQVTGTRQDAYANAHRTPVEQDKPADEKGKYVHPTELGQPVSLGVDYEEQQLAQQQLEKLDKGKR